MKKKILAIALTFVMAAAFLRMRNRKNAGIRGRFR